MAAPSFLPVKSSWIEGVTPYDPIDESFQIRLKNGAVYTCPSKLIEYNGLLAAKSIGTHFNKVFRERAVPVEK